MSKTIGTGKKFRGWAAGFMATLAAASLALTGLVVAGMGASADPLDGVTGIIPDKTNPSGVTDKIYPGAAAYHLKERKGTICGFVFVEAGDYNTRGGLKKNNSGGYFNPKQGDIALEGAVVHGLVLTKEGEVIPRQHGTTTQPLTAVTDAEGRYCFDFKPYGMDELDRGLKSDDVVKVWPEPLKDYDAYPDGLLPHFWNGAGRATPIETQTLTFLAQGGIVAGTFGDTPSLGNPYTGGTNTLSGYIDGLNFSYKPPADITGSHTSGESPKHLPESQWEKPYGTDEQHAYLISLGEGKDNLSRIQKAWWDAAGKAPYSKAPTPDKAEHPWVCGYTFLDTSIQYNMFNRDGSEAFLPNVRILASIAEADSSGNITGVRSTQVTTSDEMGRYCFVWKDWDTIASKRKAGYTAPKIMITAYPEDPDSFHYVPTVNPSANTWLELSGHDVVAMNEVFSPAGHSFTIGEKTEMRPFYENQTSWGQWGPTLFNKKGTFRVAPWFLGFAPSTSHADYSMNYGYTKQQVTVDAHAVLPDLAPYAIYWAKEGTLLSDLSSGGTEVARVDAAASGESTASFKVPENAEPGRYTMYLVSLNDDGTVKYGNIHDMDTFVVVKERGVYFNEASKRDSIRKYDLWNEDKAQIQDIDDEGNPMVDKRGKPIMVDNPYLLTKEPTTSKQVIEGYAGDPAYAFFRGIEEKDHKGVVSGEEHNTYTLRMVPTGTTANPEIIKENIAGIIEENSGEKLTLRVDVDFNIPAVDPGDYEIQLISASGEIVDRHAYKVKEGPKVEVAAPKSAKQGATSPQITVKDKRDGHDYKLQFIDAAGKVTEIADGATSFTVPADAALGNGSVALVDITDPAKPLVVAKDTLKVLDGIPPVIHADDVTKYSGQQVVIPVKVTDNVDANLTATCTSSASWLTWNTTAKQMEGTIPDDQVAGDVTIICNATDSAGNEAEQKTVTLTVQDKPTDPALVVDKTSAEPGDSVNAKVIAPKADKTYKVQLFDPEGNAIGDPVDVPEAGVAVQIPAKAADGNYKIKLYEDATSDPIDEAVVKVADNTAPDITAPDSIEVTTGNTVPDGNEIIAEDDVDGKVSPSVVIGPEGSGLTYDPETGKLTGKAKKPGEYIITVTAKDAKNNTVSKEIPLVIRADETNPTIDDVLGLSEGKIIGKTGQAIQKVTIKASDDSGEVTLSVKDGTTLPKGLTFDSETGVISGIPQEVGTGSFTIVATDPSGNKTEQEIPYVITDGVKPTVKDPGHLKGVVGEEVSLPIEAKDESGTVTCKADGLPNGLTIDPATCTISGTPTEGGSGNVVVTVTDEADNSTTITIPYDIVDKNADSDGDGISDYDEDTKCYNPNEVNGTGQIDCPSDPKDQHHTDKNDPDSDGDGVPDGQELEDGTNPLNPDSFKDSDGDGVPDYIDKCPDTPNGVEVDDKGCPIDGGSGNDTDGDGLTDEYEDTKCYDPTVVDGTGQIDCPSDPGDQHHTDKNDPDSDGDGVPDGQEIKDGTNPLNPDSFKDSDGDGVPDYVEEKDGTDPNDPNDYKDTDGDGVPDYVEEYKDKTDPKDPDSYKDTDGDEVPDYIEEHKDKTDPKDPDSYKDTDGDGVPDYVEEKEGTDPKDPKLYKDSDKDGLPDYTERHTCYDKNAPGAVVVSCTTDDGKPNPNAAKTDPNNPDTDGDGVPDGYEVAHNTNPVNPLFPEDVGRPDKATVKPSNGSVIEGSGPPGTNIEIWVDDRLVGEGAVDNNGNFSVKLDESLPAGTHFTVYAVDPQTGVRSKPVEGVVKAAEAPVAPRADGGGAALAVTGTNAGALNALGFLVFLGGLTLVGIRQRQRS